MKHRTNRLVASALATTTIAAVALAAPVAIPSLASAAPTSPPVVTGPGGAPSGPLRAMYSTAPPAAGAQPATSVPAIPTWTHAVNGFTFRMVGKNLFVHQATPTTNVPAVLIPITAQFLNSSNAVVATFDANATSSCLPAGSPSGSPATLTLASPIFQAAVYPGITAVGSGQYLDEFQRANFRSQTKTGGLNPAYNVDLSPVTSQPITVGFKGGTLFGSGCGELGEFDKASWDAFVRSNYLEPTSSNYLGIPATTMPIFLFSNVVLTSGGCCILGYHGAFTDSTNAVRTYATADFDTSGDFTASADVAALSHEIGEWMDDPTVLNATPSWGHIGQVTACQHNLEVGDPLTGTMIAVTMSNTFTYHLQELAFMSWFFDQKPSLGISGWFSSHGTFKVPAVEPCH